MCATITEFDFYCLLNLGGTYNYSRILFGPSLDEASARDNIEGMWDNTLDYYLVFHYDFWQSFSNCS